jgi:hypothetical protein
VAKTQAITISGRIHANREPIWSVTGTATAIQAFLIGIFLFWNFIPDYVPAPESGKVFVESTFSLAIVIVIVVHAMMYYKQAKEANRQAQSSAQLIEVMVLTELPYIRVGDWKPPRICESNGLHVEARLRNAGRTIAWDITAGSRGVKIGTESPTKLPLIPTGEKTWNGYGALDTSDSMTIQFKSLPKLTDEQISELQSGKISIFVDGVVTYQDSMGGKSYYTYGYTLNFKHNIIARYERHHRVKANPN